MARLPAGTKAAAAFAESAIVLGIRGTALSLFPGFLGLPIIGSLILAALEKIVRKYLASPVISEEVKYALGAVYASSRAEYDKQFIYLKTLDKQATTPEELEKAIQNAENAMEKFVRRGPIE